MIQFKENILLKEYSSYRIGGPARFFFEAEDHQGLISGLQYFERLKEKLGDMPIFVLGSGTNILFNDSGFPGLVIKININFINWQDENLVEAGAGTLMSDLVLAAAEKGRAGLEWAAGLPGTIGGAVRGNAGAFGSEIKDSLIDVLSIDFCCPDKLIRRAAIDCDFDYRSSIFKKSRNQEIIIAASFKLSASDRDLLKKKMDEWISYRHLRQPLEYPSAGSIFKNVPWEKLPIKYQNIFEEKKKEDPFPVVPAVCLIANAGLKGKSRGGAEISEKHPNFIINKNNAKADDILFLIELVKKEVLDKFEVELEEEIKIFN